MTFADYEPEDSWSPGDPVRELLDNLCRRCSLLGEPTQLPADATDVDRADEIGGRLRRWRQTSAPGATARDRQRAHDIARHLQIVRTKLDG